MYLIIGKRLLDLLLVITAVVIVLPVLLGISLVILASMGRPVVFSQMRPGLRGTPFQLFKFRTMRDDRDAKGAPLGDDARLTPVGRFLRSTSLDELPELVNVLRGDMSLVGPRPLLMQYLERYSPEQRRRHEVKPGITGWAQVNGRNAVSWEQKFAMDVWYVDHVSFWLDLKIIGKTIWKILTQEGISQPGHATAREFMGSKG